MAHWHVLRQRIIDTWVGVYLQPFQQLRADQMPGPCLYSQPVCSFTPSMMSLSTTPGGHVTKWAMPSCDQHGPRQRLYMSLAPVLRCACHGWHTSKLSRSMLASLAAASQIFLNGLARLEAVPNRLVPPSATCMCECFIRLFFNNLVYVRM